MSIKIKVEKAKDGTYWGTTQNLPGAITSDGKNLAELKENLQDALQLYYETAEDLKDEEIKLLFVKEIELEYEIQLSEIFEKFKVINKSAFAERIGISPSLMRQYASKKDIYVSEERAKKIEKELHLLGEELRAVKL